MASSRPRAPSAAIWSDVITDIDCGTSMSGTIVLVPAALFLGTKPFSRSPLMVMVSSWTTCSADASTAAGAAAEEAEEAGEAGEGGV
jgi:hypothetical protein